jgi:hypothetical protein
MLKEFRAFAMLLVVKGLNAMRTQQAAAPAATSTSEKPLAETRSLLKMQDHADRIMI